MSDVDVHNNENSPLFSVIEPEKAKKVFKSKLKRSEKRASNGLMLLYKHYPRNWMIVGRT